MKALWTGVMAVVVSGMLFVGGCDQQEPTPTPDPTPTPAPAPAPETDQAPVDQAPVDQAPAENGSEPMSLDAAGAAVVAAAEGEYPLTVCVVSNEKLGSMGDPIVLEHEGQKVQICCEGCEETFNADPAKYVAKVAAARAAQSETATN